MRIAGDGPPLLLIAGLGATIDMWPAVEERLRGRTTISFDPPGVGESDMPLVPLRLPALARIACEIVSEVGYGRVDVLGYSLGGAIAQEVARRAPEMVDHLVLCATGPGLGGLPPRNPVVPLVLATPYRFYDPVHYASVAPLVAGGRTARDREVLQQQIAARCANPPGWLGYAAQLWAAWGWSSLHYLHRLPHRTLVVAGEDDPISPVANARLLASRIPRARLHVIPEAGHLFLLDEPAKAVPEIDAFLSEADPRRDLSPA